MDGDKELVRAPKIVMGLEDRANASSTSSEMSPEWRWTLSRGLPGTISFASSHGPMKYVRFGRAESGRRWDVDCQEGDERVETVEPLESPNWRCLRAGVRWRKAHTESFKEKLQEKWVRR